MEVDRPPHLWTGPPQEYRANRYSSQSRDKYFTSLCGVSEAGSYVRFINSNITQFNAQRLSRTCKFTNEEEGGGRTRNAVSVQLLCSYLGKGGKR